MRITISGIEEVQSKFEKLGRIEKPIMDGIREVMEEAQAIAMRAYALQGNGNESYMSDLKRIENGYVLSMGGADVGFLEFGAGVYTEGDEFANEVGYAVYPGSWSESHAHSENPNARYFAKNGFWWYNNIRYTGLTPTRGMQRALDHVRNEIQSAVERKINEWIGS